MKRSRSFFFLAVLVASMTGHAANDTKKTVPPERTQVLLGGETFLLNKHHAFLMAPEKAAASDTGKPWIFYGATLKQYPDKAESWMHQKFLDAGIAVAGIDVGEAYGSPLAFPHFEALYQEMVKRGYSKKPALLGRSRGGLWISSWALKYPDRVAGIGGIYPVYDYTSYPGTKRAAPAYGLSEAELLAQQDELNPIKRADELADAKVPVFIIHGKDDKVVSLAANSAALEKIYEAKGAGDLIDVIKIDGQGHNFWRGFFECQELVDFLIEKAKPVKIDEVALEKAIQAKDLDKIIALTEAAPKGSGVERLRGQVFQTRGVERFFAAKIKESIADFDAYLAIEPGEDPRHWQRGLAYYYAEEYAKGVAQFERHQTVNSQDVENAVWHFICVVRAPGGTVEKARKNFIDIQRDTRVPMAEIHALFAGKGSEEAVLKSANSGTAKSSRERRNHLCYAHLYLGLYFEALGETEKAKAHMVKSAVDYKMDHYMGKTAQVHAKLCGWVK